MVFPAENLEVRKHFAAEQGRTKDRSKMWAKYRLPDTVNKAKAQSLHLDSERCVQVKTVFS